MRRSVLAAALLLAAVSGASALPAGETPHYDISVRLDPVTRSLEGEATLTLPPDASRLALGTRFQLQSISAGGEPLSTRTAREGGYQLIELPPARRGQPVTIRWRGTLAELNTGLDHRQVLERLEPAAGPDGAFLPGNTAWYPLVPERLASYRLNLELPAGQRGLVAGTLTSKEEAGGKYRARFEFPHPGEPIDLLAGPYEVEERSIAGLDGRRIALRTWFHPRVAELSGAYLDALVRYFELYERRIGPYPFDSFSVVSSPLPTGFGMPTLTYLGESVLRLPFIRDTSLGHEVLHNWWGNSVYPDYRRGNWAEGLATFMADYAYKEMQGEEAARAMRLAWLRDITAVAPSEDFPVAEFTSRTHGTSQIVGYNKPAMFFFMLRESIGREAFDAGVRRFYREHRFRTAGWDDLRRAFEAEAGRGLEDFFRQWLTRPGAPELRLAAAGAAPSGGGWRASVTVAQREPAFRLALPLRFELEGGAAVTRVLEVAGRESRLGAELPGKPLAVELDPEFRALRRLAPDEAPPILTGVMIDPAAGYLVLEEGGAWRAASALIASRILDSKPSAPTTALAADSMVVFGTPEAVGRWLAARGLPGIPEALRGHGSAQAWTVARAGAKPLLLVAAKDAAALEALARPLRHYGRESWVAFEGARALERGIWPAQPQRLAVEIR
ncbi:MAG TPA: M1 family aminopeptidase [Burkholderiales bacterium]|nr:M1 family aminopeptidase [Burkholderiales bacterium]